MLCYSNSNELSRGVANPSAHSYSIVITLLDLHNTFRELFPLSIVVLHVSAYESTVKTMTAASPPL